MEKDLLANELLNLKYLVKELRGPNGCMWDKEQNYISLIPYLIEESYELSEAIRSNNREDICEELGDVLFQVFILSEISEELGYFDLTDVVKIISEKIVRRHPHVFSGVKVNSIDEIKKNWEEIKKQEKLSSSLKSKNKLYDKVFKRASGLPPLMKAQRLGEISNQLNFDWNDAFGVWEKVIEEFNELKVEMQNLKESSNSLTDPDPIKLNRIFQESGDLYFSISQLLRHLKLDAMESAEAANLKFEKRFNLMNDLILKQGLKINDLTLEQKEHFWNTAKVQLDKG